MDMRSLHSCVFQSLFPKARSPLPYITTIILLQPRTVLLSFPISLNLDDFKESKLLILQDHLGYPQLMTRPSPCFPDKTPSPGQCGSDGWASHVLKACQFNSQSGTCPDCRLHPKSACTWKATDRNFSLFLSLFLFKNQWKHFFLFKEDPFSQGVTAGGTGYWIIEVLTSITCTKL